MSMRPFPSSTGASCARAHRVTVHTMLLATAAIAGTGMLLAACSSSPSSSYGSGTTNQGAAGLPTTGKVAHRAASEPSAGPAYGGVTAPEPATAPQGSRGSLVLSTQSIIYTAYLTLRVKNVATISTTATNIVSSVGGYVSDEQELIPNAKHVPPQITLTFKVPVTEYHQILAKFGTLGHQISLSQHAQDVTQQVADVASRVTSAEAAIKQLRLLLSKAGNVGALLQVQNEINSEESTLEALIAQQHALSHETSFGTVTVTLVGPHVKVVKKHKKARKHGFGTGLRSGWHALGAVVTWLLTALGTILPFLIPVALVGAIVFESRRRMRRRRTPVAEPPVAQS
jgi:hypothetical protein